MFHVGENLKQILEPLQNGHEDDYLKLHIKMPIIGHLVIIEVLTSYVHKLFLKLPNMKMFEAKVKRRKCPTTSMLRSNPNETCNLVKNGHEVGGWE